MKPLSKRTTVLFHSTRSEGMHKEENEVARSLQDREANGCVSAKKKEKEKKKRGMEIMEILS